jgi:hypothetical protein
LVHAGTRQDAFANFNWSDQWTPVVSGGPDRRCFCPAIHVLAVRSQETKDSGNPVGQCSPGPGGCPAICLASGIAAKRSTGAAAKRCCRWHARRIAVRWSGRLAAGPLKMFRYLVKHRHFRRWCSRCQRRTLHRWIGPRTSVAVVLSIVTCGGFLLFWLLFWRIGAECSMCRRAQPLMPCRTE